MSPIAAGRSVVMILKPHWPIVLFLILGTLASLWASQIGLRSFAILVGGVAITGLLVAPLVLARRSPAAQTPLQEGTAIAMALLAKQFESVPDGILVVVGDPPRVSVNRNLAAMLQFPPVPGACEGGAELLSAVCARIGEPERLRADLARLAFDPATPIRREVRFADGGVYELSAGAMQQTAGAAQSLMSFFVFHDIADRVRIEHDLQVSNASLQMQIDASPSAILVVDHAGIVVSFNQRFTDLFHPDPPLRRGLAVDASRASFAQQVVDPDAYIARIRYLYAHPDESGIDEIVLSDGTVFERHSVALRATATGSLGRIWFFNDITAMRSSARRSQEERDFVTALLDSLPGYFVLIDAAGRLVRWNESLRLLNGLSDHEIMGSDPFANIVESDRTATIAKVREVIVEGFGELEFGINTTSRGVRDIRWHGRRITVDGLPQVLAVGIDVTELRAGEALTRRSEQRFRAIFESVSDGIIVQDAVTEVFIDVNPRQCEMLGYTREEFLLLTPDDVTGGTRTEAFADLAALRADAPEHGVAFEWLMRAKSGNEFWVEVVRQYVNFGGREVFLSTVRDISERRRASAALTYRDRILHALAMSTAQLVRTASFAASMPAFLASVAEELDVDRILVIQREGIDQQSFGAGRIYGWQRENVPQVDMRKLSAPLRDEAERAALATWLAPLYDGSLIVTQAASATGFVRQMMLEGSTRSSLLVPISVGGAYWGHFAIDDTRHDRDWNSVETDALSTFADLVGALLTRERTEALLQRSEEQFRTVSETVLDGIIMIGSDGRIRFWNPAAERIFGYSAAEADGKVIYDWLTAPRHRDDATHWIEALQSSDLEASRGQTIELTATRKDGVQIDVEFAINGMHVGEERYAVGIARDITERKRESIEIERMASHDMLTALPNRRLFIEALEFAIRRSRRSGQLFAVFSLDLDRFKDVNDTIGHPGGDRFLQSVAERLQATVREFDTVARFGGDEFAAIQMDIREPADAAVLAEKLVEALARPFSIDGNDIHSGTSIGIAVHGPDSTNAETMLAHADVALYRAKAVGRGTYRFYTDAMDAEVRARVTLDNELREGVAQEQFFLMYQPQVDVHGRIVGIEALARWRHPTRGVIEPVKFIPAAERSGLIITLGAWVFREACCQTRRWLDAGITAPRVAVNVSALQFKNPLELEKSIMTIVGEAGVPPNVLELELTESALMEASQDHNEVLRRLRGSGFRIAIDDFGNGYSSLDYLRRFPVDLIKIPQNFIADVGVTSEDAPIVRATIGLCRELGITVLAEGVETAHQFALLKEWGCQEIQGYYFARPLAADAVVALLRAGTIVPPG
jgi:diguanylate cyclase (GGDEF)-like protein/PAS domain S-box-containing protein